MPQVKNLARSAIAPEISAGVMIANISWNAANTRTGIGQHRAVRRRGC